MSSEDKADSLRNAIITSNDPTLILNGETSILEVLKDALPQGYSFKQVEPEKINGNYDKVIQTPSGDEICVIPSDDGLSVRTGNIMEQDALDVQPDFAADELSKLAVQINQGVKVYMQVMGSNNDLKGKK